jgi:putative hydrolase of the HAD superfamily
MIAIGNEMKDTLKAILFDAGNTLVWLDHPYLVSLLAEHGVTVTEEEILGAEYSAKLLLDELVRSGDGGDDASRGAVYFARIFGELGVPESAFNELALKLYARHAERNLWSLVRPGTVETLQALRAAGYRLAVISNADGRVESLLESVGLAGHFEFILDSAVVGIEKPDPRIFHLACDRLGVPPSDALYVGDIYEIDVVGARSAGLRACLIDPLGRWDFACERIGELGELRDLIAAAPSHP